MMNNFKIVLEYDGTAYHGWQRQKNNRTIQGEIEKAIATMTGKAIVVAGSGRTDAGVHALGQAAHFKTDADLTSDVFQRGLNSLLPDDILIRECRRMPMGFHARYDVKSKIYQYRILNQEVPSVFDRYHVWHIKKRLDTDAMMKATEYLVGPHDFKAFEGTGSPRSSTVRNVFRAALEAVEPGYIYFEIEADGFLRYMVRNIVGTLADVGRGKISPEQFNDILLFKNRHLAGATAPARGLFLMKVNY